MRYNEALLDSIARGKTQLRTADEICEDIYGFNAFGFYHPDKPNMRRYFIAQMENYLHENKSTENVTSTMLFYLLNDKEPMYSESRRKRLFDFMFNTSKPVTKEEPGIFDPEFYRNMDIKDGITLKDKEDIINFLSNPYKNNSLYKTYFRHSVIDFFSMKPNESFSGEDLEDKEGSVFNVLTNYYSKTWENIANKVPSLIRTIPSDMEKTSINQNILFTTGYPLSSFRDKEEFHKFMYGDVIESNVKQVPFNDILETFDDRYIIADTSKNYCTVVGLNYSKLKEYLKRKYKMSNNAEFAFRAIFDNQIKTVKFGIDDSKSDSSTIFFYIVPKKEHVDKSLEDFQKNQHIDIRDTEITILVELSKWRDEKTGYYINKNDGDWRDRPVIGKIPIRYLYSHYYLK